MDKSTFTYEKKISRQYRYAFCGGAFKCDSHTTNLQLQFTFWNLPSIVTSLLRTLECRIFWDLSTFFVTNDFGKTRFTDFSWLFQCSVALNHIKRVCERGFQSNGCPLLTRPPFSRRCVNVWREPCLHQRSIKTLRQSALHPTKLTQFFFFLAGCGKCEQWTSLSRTSINPYAKSKTWVHS